jgi:nitrite reductase/ring-hydroxylating ferredoxin subunit
MKGARADSSKEDPMAVSRPLRPLVDALEDAAALDTPGEALGKAVRSAIAPGTAKDALSGTWLTHAVHPPLTDVVIGSFLGASLVDLLSPGSEEASERLLLVGLAAAVPTALSGANDWADTEIADARIRRVGLVHASVNVSALTLYALSLAARRRGSLGGGRALALAGAAALTAGGFLGGHMSYTRGVGPNQTAFDPGPTDWTVVADAGQLEEGRPMAATAGDTPVFLLRHGDDVHAMHDRCSHRGCSLSDGVINGHVITCACHGSQFDVRNGSVLRGPATAEQPVFDARTTDGRIEVRLGTPE